MHSEAATARRPYQPADMRRSMHVMDGLLSPDGTFAIYQLSEIVPGASENEDQQMNSLWRVDLADGEPRRLTARGKNAASPQLMPDGRAILFLSAREGGATQVYRLPLDGGESEPITSLDQGVTAFALSPDGAWIAFAAFEKAPQPPGPASHVRINRFAYRLDPVPGFLQELGQAIYLMPAAGGEHRALTPHDGIVGAMVWSPDSREIAAVVLGKASQRWSAVLGELCVVDREGETRTLIEKAFILGHFFTADSQHVGYIGPPDGNISRQPQLFLVSRNGGTPVSRTAMLDLAVGGVFQTSNPAAAARDRLQLSAGGAAVIAPVCKGGESALYEIALTGPERCQRLIGGPRICKVLGRAGTRLLYLAQDFTTPNELWVAEPDGEHERVRVLTRHNAAWREEINWPRVEQMRVSSEPGVEVEGWILLPPQGRSPFKTLLFIHGGPHAAWGYSFNEDFQELAGAGYAIAFANPRGSTGYGDAFSTAIVGRWGRPEFTDLNAFLDELVGRGIADPERLGVSGVSGGGHLSAWLIGHTDRFKAAVPEQGVYNMVSMYGVSDVGVDLVELEMGGPPREQMQRYWELSPVAYAHRCKTPTLLIQGEMDVRCPMEQAEQLYMTLKHNGCEVELLRLRNCNHGAQLFGPPSLRRFRMEALKDWFDRHIA